MVHPFFLLSAVTRLRSRFRLARRVGYNSHVLFCLLLFSRVLFPITPLFGAGELRSELYFHDAHSIAHWQKNCILSSYSQFKGSSFDWKMGQKELNFSHVLGWAKWLSLSLSSSSLFFV